jgi:hypothetical protein
VVVEAVDTKDQEVVFQLVMDQEVLEDLVAVAAQVLEETQQAALTKVHRADTQDTATAEATDNLVGPVAAEEEPAVEAKVHRVLTMAEMAEQVVKVLSQDRQFTIPVAAEEPDKTVQTEVAEQVAEHQVV